MSSSRRYGGQEITMVTTSNASDWKVYFAESFYPSGSQRLIKWYALGNVYYHGVGDGEGTPVIDFSGNTGSETVTIKSSRGLTRILSSDMQLTKLDVSKNVNLRVLSCGSNQLTTLDVTKNIRITYIHCTFTQLPELDVSKNIALNRFYCYSNPNLTIIYVNQTQLDKLNGVIPSDLDWKKDLTATYVLKQ
ncbi:hypothetical protein [Tenacibaculum piscium]|uniref:hypothetical protein n=1 Tax=Tenacibaculum piscium TaxID=1458515 RepID=UPI001F44FEDA|nr:hypothetical protein [Tenacibaculum piscium]